jgi:hypothetical protein
LFVHRFASDFHPVPIALFGQYIFVPDQVGEVVVG